MVIEKNNIIIFIGLTAELFVNWLNTSLIGAKEQIIKMAAPNNAIIQYVPNLIFPILIVGNTKSDTVINMNVVIEIIIVGIIRHERYYLSFL